MRVAIAALALAVAVAVVHQVAMEPLIGGHSSIFLAQGCMCVM